MDGPSDVPVDTSTGTSDVPVGQLSRIHQRTVRRTCRSDGQWAGHCHRVSSSHGNRQHSLVQNSLSEISVGASQKRVALRLTTPSREVWGANGSYGSWIVRKTEVCPFFQLVVHHTVLIVSNKTRRSARCRLKLRDAHVTHQRRRVERIYLYSHRLVNKQSG